MYALFIVLLPTMNCWNWNTYFVDPLSLLCLTCFKADDVHWSTDDAGTIFHVNIFFHWEREECSKSVMHYGWDPSLTVLVIGDDNQPRVERTLNCKATEVVFFKTTIGCECDGFILIITNYLILDMKVRYLYIHAGGL